MCRALVGKNDRSERVRPFNYAQDRITHKYIYIDIHLDMHRYA